MRSAWLAILITIKLVAIDCRIYKLCVVENQVQHELSFAWLITLSLARKPIVRKDIDTINHT